MWSRNSKQLTRTHMKGCVCQRHKSLAHTEQENNYLTKDAYIQITDTEGIKSYFESNTKSGKSTLGPSKYFTHQELSTKPWQKPHVTSASSRSSSPYPTYRPKMGRKPPKEVPFPKRAGKIKSLDNCNSYYFQIHKSSQEENANTDQQTPLSESTPKALHRPATMLCIIN